MACFHHEDAKTQRITKLFFASLCLRARQRITFALCCRPPGPLARRERRAYPLRDVRSEQRSQRACGPQPEGARRRGAVCVVDAPRRCTAASPASRRLASGPSALAPKCKCYSVTGPNLLLSSTASLLGAIEPLRDPG